MHTNTFSLKSGQPAKKDPDHCVLVRGDPSPAGPIIMYSWRVVAKAAGDAASKANDYLRAAYHAVANSRVGCMAAYTAAGAVSGAVVGAEGGAVAGTAIGTGVGAVGFAGGPTGLVTTPAGAGAGGLIGGVVGGAGGGIAGGTGGYALGQAVCRSGTGSGGGGGRTSPNQMNQQAQKGQAPASVDRVDTPRFPHEQPHIEFKDGNALNIDGTWKHGGRALTNEEANWITSNGWSLPRQ